MHRGEGQCQVCCFYTISLGVVSTLSRRNRLSTRKFAAGENVAYRNHYGGGWCVSVTSGFYCVDLRKFYLPIGATEWKPTKTGIALRLSEWATFRNLIDVVQRDHLTVANFTPCFLNQDHTTLEGMQACRECNPYTVTPSPAVL